MEKTSTIEKILAAVLLCVRAHGNQKRKYTGEPYSVHLAHQ